MLTVNLVIKEAKNGRWLNNVYANDVLLFRTPLPGYANAPDAEAEARKVLDVINVQIETNKEKER